jgi:hypothetical protein
MTHKPIPDVDVLHQLLSYDEDSGRITYRTRFAYMFPDCVHGRQHSCDKWNTRHDGKFADAEISNKGYRRTTLWEERYSTHRLIWKMRHGVDPDVIDHIDGDRTNNRIGNLRSVDLITNQRNRAIGKNNTAGVTGVHWCNTKSRWIASAKVGSKRIRKACRTFEEACAARAGIASEHGFTERPSTANRDDYLLGELL